MYMELSPQDTIQDLQRLLTSCLSGFEFPRKNLYDYTIDLHTIPIDDLRIDDFILGITWNEITDIEEEKEQGFGTPRGMEWSTVCNYNMCKNWDEMQHGPKPKGVFVDKSCFEAQLTSEEIEILAILMMNGWLQRQITSIENTRMKYSGSDFKMTSQANHLSKLQSLLGECQRQSHHLQRLYKRRALSKEGIYESTWDWFGKHGTSNIR